MRNIYLIGIGLISMILVGCQPAATEQAALPTVRSFPTETNTPMPTNTAIPTETSVPTETPTLTLTPTQTNTPTETLTPSITPTPSNTPIPTETPDGTAILVGTSTAQVAEAPVFSTFTPLPPGAVALVARPTSTGTPEVVADVIIDEAQFQEEIDRLLQEDEDSAITQARVSMIPAGVEYELTAQNEGVFVTGTVLVPFTYSGGSFNNIVTIGGAVEITMSDDIEPPESFLSSATTIVTLTQEAFNFILNQRLGEGNHNLEAITIENGRMLISLLVPEPESSSASSTSDG